MQIKTGRKSSLLRVLGVIAVSLLVGACASADKSAVQTTIGSAESALNQAIKSDAREHAPLELRLAQEKLSQAKAAVSDGNLETAGYLAEEAMADARLAEAKADNAKTEHMVETLRNSIEQLRREIEQRNAVQ